VSTLSTVAHRRLLSLGFFDSLSFLDDMDALHRQCVPKPCFGCVLRL
jgi:hypothetical protein